MLGRKADVEQALDRDNCEIKILALQSLFRQTRTRHRDRYRRSSHRSYPCPGFQAAAVSMLGSHGGPRVVPLMLRHRSQQSRSEAPSYRYQTPGRTTQRSSRGDLIKIYDADRTKEIRIQVLQALIESRTAVGSAKVLEIALATTPR